MGTLLILDFRVTTKDQEKEIHRVCVCVCVCKTLQEVDLTHPVLALAVHSPNLSLLYFSVLNHTPS